MPAVTVWTPTYNRREALKRPYNALVEQTCKDFEWLIVDDRSDDGTKERVTTWRQNAEFPIRFVEQPQDKTGKHRAFNIGVQLADGQFFSPLDSDDSMPSDAIELMLDEWEQIPKDQRNKFAGVAGYCKTPDGEIVGQRLPDSPMDTNLIELRYRYGISEELWGMHKTDILRQFTFPDIDERFVPEDLVWDRVAQQYSRRYVNKAFRIYYPDENDDQLTKLSLDGIAEGHYEWHKMRLNEQSNWIPQAPFTFFKSAVHYTRFGIYSGRSVQELLRDVIPYPSKALVFAGYPIGYLISNIHDQI
ncbi:glycosyltransferase family 2 protein [Halorussus gelatinilyticus]|uniref:Glycosyltransferase family 2 protein n=1 Tax=Halorussus gelatinilyticus TaxID=2937524 RepID=A0A8U0IM62_9EURY|nr:glycosyltransferase family A protein [Halorussus gelatinilyticus]UPW01294.1 glycosyltransferase family 2 protein [Halorussus gelatinilyticus]